MNNVSCRHDMTEILLKVSEKTPFNQSINHYIESANFGNIFTVYWYFRVSIKDDMVRGFYFFNLKDLTTDED